MVIVEPSGLSADRVGAAVRSEWALDVTSAVHVEAGADAWHWRIDCDDDGPWFATVDAVRSSEERQGLLAAYEAAAQLAPLLDFVTAPVRTRDARMAVDIAPGPLLSLTPFLDGASGGGPLVDDEARAAVARLLGELHRQPRPRHLPVWRPQIGWHSHARRADLERLLALGEWSGGPWSAPVGRLLAEARPVVERAMRRFALLGAAVAGSVDRWVVTHGEPHTANLMSTPDGLRLVDWATICLAPRERDLREVLGEADGNEPWFAYVGAGGRPEPLSPDTNELFALQRHLSEIVEHAVRFSRAHTDSADDRRCFDDLEVELAALVDRWS